MRTIETKAIVTPDGKMTVQLPPDIMLGEHGVVVVIEEKVAPNSSLKDLTNLLQLHSWAWGGYLPEETFRREDMYGDDGR